MKPRQAVWNAFASATERHEEPSAVADELNAAIPSPGLPFWLGSQNVRDPNRAFGKESLRRTETAVDAQTEATPSSVFRIGGEASVGALAVWGIPVLRRLEELGFAIWPFDGPGTKTIVEIFPRSLWAATQPDAPVRSTPLNREDFLPQHKDIVPSSEMRDKFAGNRREFDALYTAWALREYGGSVGEMGVPGEEWTVEGQIWLPAPSARIN